MNRFVDGSEYIDQFTDSVGQKRLRVEASLSEYTNEDGVLKVVPSHSPNVTGYNTLITENITPAQQNYHLYGIASHSQLHNTITTISSFDSSPTSQIVTNESRNASVLDVIAPFGLAALLNKRVLKYRAGMMNFVRLHCVMPPSEAGKNAAAGVSCTSSGLYFNQPPDGGEFSVRIDTGGVNEIQVFTVTTAASAVENATVVLNDEVFTVPLTDAGGDTAFTAYELAKASYESAFTRWLVVNVGSTVIFTDYYSLDRPGAYLITSPSMVGSLTQKRQGVRFATVNIPQSLWNGPSPMVQNLDPLKHNLYEIEYSWMGGSNIIYKVYNPDTSRFEPVHTLQNANVSTGFSLTMPNMYAGYSVTNLFPPFPLTGLSLTTTGIYTGTYGVFNVDRGVKHVVEGNSTVSFSGEENIIVLGGRCEINGVQNESELIMRSVSVTSDGTKPVKIRIIKNAAIGSGIPSDYVSWSYFDESESLALLDTTSITRTGGNTISSTVMGKADSLVIDLKDQDVFIACGETLIITAESSSNTVSAAVTFIEDI